MEKIKLMDEYNKYLYLQKLKQHYLKIDNNPTNFNRWILSNDDELKNILKYKNKENSIRELIELKKRLNKIYEKDVNYKKTKIIIITINSLKIKINEDIYNKLYKKNDNEMDIIRLLLKYEIFENIGSNRNMQGSLPDKMFDYLKEIGIEYELFASPFYNHLEKYCSAFTIDRKFGAISSFFDFIPTSQKFYAQAAPPNGESFLEKVIDKLLEIINNKIIKEYLVILFAPDWVDYKPYKKLLSYDVYIIPKNIQVYETKHIYNPSSLIRIPNSSRVYILTNTKINTKQIYDRILEIYASFLNIQ